MSFDPNLFTYTVYQQLIALVQEKGFQFSHFSKKSLDKPAYLRHDLDFSLEHGLKLAEREWKQGVHATYFIMVGQEAYNLPEKKDLLKPIIQMGHDIGLHYVLGQDPSRDIPSQSEQLSDLLDYKITSFSVHRPANLAATGFDASQIEVEGYLNTYSPQFFKPGQYISDSNHFWRCGDPREFLKRYPHQMIQILTHPIWWTPNPQNRFQKVEKFLSANSKLNKYLSENVSFMKE